MVDTMKTALETTGFPVAYSHFESRVSLPYIAFRELYTKNMYADNQVFAIITRYAVELCTNKKEPDTEKKMTDVLDSHGITWQKISEEYIEDDGVFSIIFEFEEVTNYED